MYKELSVSGRSSSMLDIRGNSKHFYAPSLAGPTGLISCFQALHNVFVHLLRPLNSELIPLPEQEHQMMKDDLDCVFAVELCVCSLCAKENKVAYLGN